MFLKSIEIQGFKSFANRIVFEFGRGITGIVGPNGSGKSNVTDAVRWVFGEQSAKQLRGFRMEDVIFSGTENRKPLGFAYVAITLDNSDHSLETDYDSVTVSRRMYRSGESEYKINGHLCRLKDIQEMFYDTGIGKEGYSVIGQGQIDKILSDKPEDRRELFDEAAGIVKYKRRKSLTEKNLAQEQANLDRVKDILNELEKQIGPLKSQSEAAKTYLEYRDELKLYDANIYVKSYDQLKSDADAADEKITIIRSQLEDTRDEYEKNRSSYENGELKLEALDADIGRIQSECSDLAVSRQKLEGEHALLVSQRDALCEKKSQTSGDNAESAGRLSECMKSLNELTDQKNALESELAQLEEEETSFTDRADDYGRKISQIRAQIDGHSADIIELLNQTAALKGRMERYDAMKEQDRAREAELDTRLAADRDRLSSEDNILRDLKKEESSVCEKLEEVSRNIALCSEDSSGISRQLDRCLKELSEKEKASHEQNARYQTLSNLAERYEGYGSSVRRIMEQKADHPGIIGVVADLIKVRKEYETAIETALGGSISNIVTADEAAAREMIEFLKRNKAGRATFLPLSSIQGRVPDNADRVCSEPGVIGLASRLVDTQPEYVRLAQYLLGRIFVVSDMDSALALAKKYHYSLRIVTLEGELLNPGGSISGGAYRNSGNLLGRRRELEELKDSVRSLKTEIKQQNDKILDLQGKADENKKTLQEYTDTQSELTLSLNTVRMRLKQEDENRSGYQKSIDSICAEKKQISDQIAKLDSMSGEIGTQMSDIDRSRSGAESAIESLTQDLSRLESEEKEFAAQTSDVRIRYANAASGLQFNSENIARIQAQIDDLNGAQAQYAEQIADIDGRIAELDRQISDNETNAARTDALSKDRNGDLSGIMEKRAHFASAHKEILSKREELSGTISELEKEELRLDHQKDRIDENRTKLGNYMWEEYSLTHQGAMAMARDDLQSYSSARLSKLASDMKGKIRDLGSVNVNAIEEYKTVSERYDKMKEQYCDMADAEKKLSGIIDSLNVSMEEQFREKFSLIKEEFDKVFKELFGGGKGTLELSDPDNILETGIIITAQPPGKKLQNMMQLSGGEKALTAIALLFAIQRLKPSPFCLLDEIEAALDDANVKRFAQYLRRLSDETQFIVITHRRGTMNAADVLYGITMQEKGVSSLVSVSLVESELK